jgi:predicted MFS family arabinose efflux permease
LPNEGGFAVLDVLQKFLRTAGAWLDARSRKSDINYRLLVPIVLFAGIVQATYALVRVTTSYRAIELDLPVIWLGIISATFALLPIFLAVWVGRFIDRGYDAQAAWIGAGLMVAACAGFCLWSDSAAALLIWSALLGISHLFLMASQQMLCVRSAGPRGRDSAFGNYLVAGAIGQGAGPYVIAWAGGAAKLPPTGYLFAIGLAVALAALLTSAALRPGPPQARGEGRGELVPVRALLRQRGLMAVLVASVITITAQDLITIYLPLLGAERNMSASDIGILLTIRAVASMISRLLYARAVRIFGRARLTLASMLGGGLAFVLLAVPMPIVLTDGVAVLLGLALGIATTLSLTNVVEIATPAATGTVMSLRITGNRIGQVAMPFVASLIAAVTGVGGIFVVIAISLAVSASAVHLGRKRP